MAIKVSMNLEQAKIIALAYGHELEPTSYGSSEHSRQIGGHKPDYIRRAVIQLAIDMVKAHAEELLEQMIDEALPQARSDYAHLGR
jgi:hypothetical protein